MSPLRYHIPLISCARNRSPSSHSLQFLLARRSQLRAQCSCFISDNSCNCPDCSVFCCSVCPMRYCNTEYLTGYWISYRIGYLIFVLFGFPNFTAKNWCIYCVKQIRFSDCCLPSKITEILSSCGYTGL